MLLDVHLAYLNLSNRKHMKTITVANRKGGAGKSTCAAHLSIESTNAGLKVIIIDLDPQKTLENWWNKRGETEPFMADATAQDLKEKLAIINDKGIDLCIIDTPGDTSLNSQAGIEAADLVIIPSKPTAPDLTSIGRTISMVQEHNKPYIFIITQAISRAKSTLQAVSVLSEFGPVAPCPISNRVSYSNAMGTGKSAREEDKSAAEEISEIWRYIDSKLYSSQHQMVKKKIA